MALKVPMILWVILLSKRCLRVSLWSIAVTLNVALNSLRRLIKPCIGLLVVEVARLLLLFDQAGVRLFVRAIVLRVRTIILVS